jgi:alkanesulfonate monooxygenase
MEQFGDDLDHDLRYARAEEFVDVVQRLWKERTTDFDGRYFRMRAARLEPKPLTSDGPPIYLAGASESALRMAARQADVYMMSAETVEGIAKRIADLRARAAAHGRTPRFCVAATMFARETDEEARRWAREFADRADLEVLAERQRLGRVDVAVENLRFRAGTNVNTWLAPNLWSGISHLLYGSAWVGSYDALADLFARYAAAGVSIFQIYGYPFLEEATHIGERFLPLAKRRLAEVSVGV